jgi:hypothetical protein
MRHLDLVTAGERVRVACAPQWLAPILAEGADTVAGGAYTDGDGPSLLVTVQEERAPFDRRGFLPLTRGAWVRDGALLATDVCGAGFDLHLQVEAGAAPGETRAEFTLRWRPDAAGRAAHRLLRSRFHLLARAVLLQYPALWWAGVHGRVPMHAAVGTAGAATVLLAGPGGVGKTTLLRRELAAGGTAISDNVSVTDGVTAWGLVEPMRASGLGGRRMPHGRGEAPLPRRVASLRPDRVVVLRRGDGEAPLVRPCSPAAAARALTSGTYIAGELRRYWPYAALLAAATGRGPAHPPVAETAAKLALQLPCTEIVLARAPGAHLADLLAAAPSARPAPGSTRTCT